MDRVELERSEGSAMIQYLRISAPSTSNLRDGAGRCLSPPELPFGHTREDLLCASLGK
jgi:hypothetical protein